ncbi:symmetrical bis(5'-nucleosyl)-tetraphosphatase [Thioalkalivibrio sp. HK1]|uniref:symmetrical bis(5'-nucleosyl)-tetraphosphatase n=1 Tax=Thioalkalivibrio sp. HK1 TaxID=1469245 RepID=UPI00046EE5C3|nr:symmetrical bis(5'-nucleosyl)-tetraphosphatase [Thioalkalivibrio sp. HK1]
MATYVIGDVQGCYAELRSLLDTIDFDPKRDRLRFAGDLVNRGPNSLEVLRFVIDLGERAKVVLGNHELHLIARAFDLRCRYRGETIDDILEAPDRESLIRWLREQPLILCEPEYDLLMVHAGIAPAWSVDQALTEAERWSQIFRSDDFLSLIDDAHDGSGDRWDEGLDGIERLRFTSNACTRMRYCYPDGRLDFSFAGPPGGQAKGLVPWFSLRDAKRDGMRIVFGHWASLRATPLSRNLHVRCVDTGCAWGGSLTALRLDDDREFSVPMSAHC